MIDQFFKVLDALNKYSVEYILIGGFALNLYGLQRGTQDIDLFVNPTLENIKRIKKALFSVFADTSIEEIDLEDIQKYAVKLKSNSYREIDASDVKFLKFIIEKKKNGNS